MKDNTLAAHMERLKPVEKGFIVWAMNFSNFLGYEVHRGMLPFLKVHDVLNVLNDLFSDRPGQLRTAAAVRAKLKEAYNIGDSVSWTMLLSDAKVARRFGAHPERGHNIPMVAKKRVTVGIRWSLPKRDFEPDDDVLVQPHLTLRNTSGCAWYITCEKRYKEHVIHWLNTYCT